MAFAVIAAVGVAVSATNFVVGRIERSAAIDQQREDQKKTEDKQAALEQEVVDEKTKTQADAANVDKARAERAASQEAASQRGAPTRDTILTGPLGIPGTTGNAQDRQRKTLLGA